MSFETANEEQRERILTNLGTTERKLQNDVETVKEWLRSQTHLPQISGEDLIKSFLIGTKLNMEKTKKKLEAYYTIRSKKSQYYKCRDTTEKKFCQVLDAMTYVPLPQLLPNGERIHFSSILSQDISRFDPLNLTRRIFCTFDILVQEDPYTAGFYLVYDASNTSLLHCLTFPPLMIRDVIKIMIEDVFPARLKGIFYINSPSYIDFMVNRLIKPFLKKKLADRILIFREDHTALLKYLPQEVLPKDFGGDADSIANLNKAWAERLQNSRDWFLTEGSAKVDESKRPKKSSKAKNGQLYGVNGSLRNLEID